MEELAIKDMAERLNLLPITVKKRLAKHGLTPIRYVGATGIYDPSVLDIIKDSPPPGRPPKSRPKPNGGGKGGD
jgi:hypothetical protein